MILHVISEFNKANNWYNGLKLPRVQNCANIGGNFNLFFKLYLGKI